MSLTLKRSEFSHDGVFGQLLTEAGTQIGVTLEHAYDSKNGDGSYTAKLQPGTYTCKRGMHRLKATGPNFETFEVTGVQGHYGILFHVGNFNDDSDGCILLGAHRAAGPRGEPMITLSRSTFQKFLTLLKDIDSFQLTVI